MYKRHIVSNIKDGLSDSPVVLLNGARQSGKSTLMQNLSDAGLDIDYLTMDDATVLEAARKDPTAFLNSFTKTVVLDEIQRVPELFIPIKATVDKVRTPGRFILTGSANVFMLPAVSESLAGRMDILTLMPLSQGEIHEKKEKFIDVIFSDSPLNSAVPPLNRNQLIDLMLLGGFPEVISRSNEKRRMAWFNSYITTILQRDIRDIANIQGLTSMPRLLSLLAARTGKLANFAEISNAVGIPLTTIKRYLTLLEMTFMLQIVQPWSSNLSKRLIKTPKLYLCDTGLSSWLQGLTQEKLLKNPMEMGPLTEQFVLLELMKQMTWSDLHVNIFHLRTASGLEVDFILEDNQGRVCGIEVKSAGSVQAKDFKMLDVMADELGDRFVKGIVIYTGDHVVKFGEKLWAVPIQMLWEI